MPTVHASSSFTAEIELKVKFFRKIFKTRAIGQHRGSDHSMRMKRKNRHVFVRKGVLRVTRRSKLVFSLTPERFIPIGIAFQLKNGIRNPDSLEKLGLLNFTNLKLLPEQNALQVTDRYLSKDGHANDSYKFHLIFQDSESREIGIIDPPIIHGSDER